MQIAVLASPDSWYLADLARAAGGRHELTAVGFRELAGSILDGKLGVSAGEVDLRRAGALLVRAMPPGSLEQIVFRMDLLGELERAEVRVINPPRAIEGAVDKYLASARLAAAGLLVPRTVVCQTVEEGLAAFAAVGGDAAVKPLFGSEGRGIARLQDEALAQRAFRMVTQLGGVLYVQQFIPHHGFDVRVLVVGRRMFAMRRSHASDWRTNVSRGATPEPIELTAEMADLARRAADALGAAAGGRRSAAGARWPNVCAGSECRAGVEGVGGDAGSGYCRGGA